jgi:hypothetical protein
MRTGLAASTVTPGRTAPDASLTTPAIDACAYAEAGRTTSAVNRNKARLKRLISSPLNTASAGQILQNGLRADR